MCNRQYCEHKQTHTDVISLLPPLTEDHVSGVFTSMETSLRAFVLNVGNTSSPSHSYTHIYIHIYTYTHTIIIAGAN